MHNPAPAIEIFLQPGETYFGDRTTRIRTILGSCVAIVVWHPDQLIGGMCHFMLPGRSRSNTEGLDGRYAGEAFSLMLKEIQRRNTDALDYQVKMFGGGNMFPNIAKMRKDNVGVKNVLAARGLVREYGLHCVCQDMGGFGSRNLVFDVASGRVTVKRSSPHAAERAEPKPSALPPRSCMCRPGLCLELPSCKPCIWFETGIEDRE